MALAVGAVLLCAPAPAGAAVSCQTGSVLQILLTAPSDQAVVSVSGGQVNVNSVPCQTTASTNVIQAVASSTNNRVLVVQPTDFVNSDTANEHGGAQEIEFFVTLNGGSSLALAFTFTSQAGGSIRLGNGGINPNATATEVSPDADIFLTDVAQVALFGTTGPDVFTAQGGTDGTGGPLAIPLTISDDGGSNQFSGGNART
jgi:hypothetical protein